ncbi:MAG: DUF6152 family protein [Bryobacteraceae bacterium]
MTILIGWKATSSRILVWMAGVALLASGLPALAHHAFSNEFDESKPLTLEGVVTRVDWENPHVHYYIDVAQPDGTVVNWACETGGPNRLTKRGWMRDSLKSGDKVIVHGFPAKDASHSADGRKVTLANGQTIGEEPKQ